MPQPFKRPDGAVVWLPDDQAGHAASQGFVPQSAQSMAGDVTAPEDTQSGVGGAALAGITSLASGATMGLSDVALGGLLDKGAVNDVKHARDDHQIVSTIGNVVGSVAPALLSGGASLEGEEALSGVKSLMAATPAAKVAKLGSAIAAGGEGMGIAGRTLAAATAGATEGAIQNAGAYVSDVALGDRKLSADGFVGAMGQGALFGGVASGALSLSSEGLTAARRLFPKAEMTAEAASSARRAATREIQTSLDDSAHLASTADSELRNLRAQEEINNPSFKQQMDEIRLQQARDVAEAKTASARAQQSIAESKAELQKVTTESKAAKLEAAAAAKKTRPAMDFLDKYAVNENGEQSLVDALQGTKAKLDGGQTLRQVGDAENAMNARLAEVNPQAAAIYKPLQAARESSEQMSAWLDKYGGESSVAFDASTTAAKKQKIADWAKNARPNDVEGEMAAAHFQGDPENMGKRLGAEVPDHVQRMANEAGADAAHRAYLDATAEATNSSASGTELMARAQYAGKRAAAKAQDEVHTAFHRGELRVPTGDEIVSASQPASAKIDKALSHKSADFADDINETAALFTKHEAAHADLAEALGPVAPPSAQAQAQGFRGAQKVSADKAAAQTAATADAIAKAPGLGSKILDRVGDAGGAYEALRMMGVPLPDPHSIPVVGPLLSVYLKSKVMTKAFGRFGGKVAETAETTIAAKSAALRQRVYAVADSMLGATSRAARTAAVVGGGAAAALGHTLFSTDEPKKAYSSKPQAGELGELYVARAAEINAAMQPGAIEKSIRSKINTSDPEALQEIVAATTRKLTAIADAMPKPSGPTGVLEGRVWMPAKADLTQWAKVVSAVDDPAAALERAASGNASADEIKAVAKVYPSLYADGQQRVLSKLADGKITLPFAQRQALSRTWGLALDSSVQPDHAAFLQAGYQPKAPAPQPSAPMGQPTLAGPVGLGERMMTRI